MDLFQTKSLDRILANPKAATHSSARWDRGRWWRSAWARSSAPASSRSTGVAAADYAGPALVISFVLAAIGCSLAGLCYSEFATMIPVAGSAYTYAYATLGELWAWIIGWDLVLEYAVGAATVSISWSQTLSALLASLGSRIAGARLVVAVPERWRGGLINLPAVLIIAWSR